MRDLDAPRLPDLDILAELGRGAGSVVYRARRSGADYAVKVLSPTSADLDTVLAQFRREAALLASVNHPRLPRIHEVGHVGRRPYMVMDLADGRPLADLLRAGGLSVPRALGVILDVIEPLALMHDQGLVHRDIKPQNVMVLADGSARLIDFGLATREVEVADPAAFANRAVVGTLCYAAPEQAGTLRRPVDNRSDLYSIGVLLFECITGSLPFVSNDVGELLRLHATTPPPDIRHLTDAGPGVAAVVATLLAKDPDDRYGSGHALAADLRQLMADPQAAVIPGSAPVPRHTGRLCGRDNEVATLMGLWEQARSGRGAGCLLRGQEGVGLTRLTMHIADRARAQGAVVVAAFCHQDDAVPLAPLRAAMETMLREAKGHPEAQRQALHNRIRAAAGSIAPLLASLSPALEEVLGTAPLPDGDRQQQFSACLAGFFADLARMCGGMVFVIDDVQYADPGTLQVLTALAAHTAQAPLLSIGTIRAGWESKDVPDDRKVAARSQLELDLTVGPLDAAGVAELVADVLPGIDLGSSLASLLITRCQGNPFVTREYLRAIVDAGLLRPHWGSWILDADGLSALALPEDALGLVLARIGELDDEARQLLVVAAAVGTVFRAEVVAEVSAVDAGLAMTAMTTAAGLHLLELREAGDYEFLHARIRDALLDGLSPSYLTDLHQTIAEVLDRRYRASSVPAEDAAHAEDADPARDPVAERDQIFAMARHYLQGDPRRSAQRAYQVCRRAGHLSMSSHAPAQAVTFLEHANALQSGDPDLLYALGTAYQREGSYSKAVASCAEALEIESDGLRRARILLLLAEVERSRWNMAEADAAVEQGMNELHRPLPKPGVRCLLSLLFHVVAAIAAGLTGWGFGSAQGEERERDALTVALHSAGAYIATIAMRPGRRLMHSLLGLPSLNRLGAGPDYTVGISGAGFMLSVLRMPSTGSRLMNEAKTAALELNDPQLIAITEWEDGACRYLTGHDDGQFWEDVLRHHGRWLDAGHVSDAITSFAWEAAVMGRVTGARDWYQSGLQLVDRSKQEITSLITVGIVTHAAAGRAIEAETELRRVSAVLDDHTSPGLQVNLALAEIYALVEQGELGQPFQEAADRFFELGLNPRLMIRGHRLFFVIHAFGRLAQCRALIATGSQEQLGHAMQQARDAVKRLRRTASTATTKAFAQVAAAQLNVLDGRPGRALRTLNQITPLVRNTPILDYELACTTARALAAAGFGHQAQRHARMAQLIAEEAGLARRARWVIQEFGGALPGTTAGQNSVLAPALEPVGAGSSAPGVERQRLQALQDISRAAAKVLDPDELARICLDRTLRILSGERAVLFLAEDDDQPLKPHLSRDATGQDVPELTGYSASLVERVRETREPIVITGTEEGAALGAQSVVVHGLRSIMVAPLLLEGRLLGVVYLDSQVAKGIFTAGDADILLALMTHIATSLETARAAQLQVSVRTAHQQRDLAETLRGALEEMSAALEPSDVLARLLTSVARVLPGTKAWLLAEDGQALQDPELRAVLDEGRPIQGDERTVPPTALMQLIGDTPAWTVFPLRTGETSGGTGTSVGLLVLAAATTDTRSTAQAQVAGALAAQAMTAYDRAALFARVQELAVADDLTGIPNRRRFFEVAERDFAAALRHGRPLHAMMIDIDHFKRVNDSHGHATGDEVIRAVADRLGQAIRETDILGRYGGEEFALVLPDTEDGAEAAERLRHAVEAAPVQTRRGPVPVSVSIGVTAMTPGDAAISTVLMRADENLYRAKKNGRNRVESG